MNWPLAIARNRSALLAVVAAIVALIGGREGGPIARHIRNAALALLRPAESAARRLIVISARGLAVAPRLPRAFSDALRQRLAARDGSASAGMSRPPAFRLFDRRKRFGRIFRPLKLAGTPRIRTFRDSGASIPAAPPVFRQAQDECGGRTDPNALVDAGRLRLRTAALQRALADLPHQARRLARWRARPPRSGREGGLAAPARPSARLAPACGSRHRSCAARMPPAGVRRAGVRPPCGGHVVTTLRRAGRAVRRMLPVAPPRLQTTMTGEPTGTRS
jgi:hypothetical protein